jgi:hypothetical protein
LRPNLKEPILRGGYSPEIFLYVLLGNVANGYFDFVAVNYRDAEDPFRQKHALGMVSKRAMPEIGEECFRFIEPVMDWQVILWLAAKFPGAILRVFKRMSHGYTS